MRKAYFPQTRHSILAFVICYVSFFPNLADIDNTYKNPTTDDFSIPNKLLSACEASLEIVALFFPKQCLLKNQ